MSATLKWTALGACSNGWSAPTTNRFESVAKKIMQELINIITTSDLSKALTMVKAFGKTLQKYAQSILTYFDQPGASNGSTEAINGRLEHLRGTVLGFRNLTHYIARCLLKSGGFRNQLHP